MLVELFDMFQCTIMKGSIDTIAFGWLWSLIPSHAHTRHTRFEMPKKQENGKERQRENAWSSLHLVKRISRGSLIMVTIKQDGLEKLIELFFSLINLTMLRPIPAVYCMQLLDKITCPFSNYFQIFYIFAQILKYFSLFLDFLALFLITYKHFPLLSRIGPGCIY